MPFPEKFTALNLIEKKQLSVRANTNIKIKGIYHYFKLETQEIAFRRNK